MGCSHSAKINTLVLNIEPLGIVLHIAVASLVFPGLPFQRARNEIWVELQVPELLSFAAAACPENHHLQPVLPESVHHTEYRGTLLVHGLKESLQAG